MREPVDTMFRLKNAPLPYEFKTSCVINLENYLSKLKVNYFYTSLKHISIKQILTETQKCFGSVVADVLRKIFEKCS